MLICTQLIIITMIIKAIPNYNFYPTIFITVIPQPVYMNSQELFAKSSKIEDNLTATEGCCTNNSLQSVAQNVTISSPCIVTSNDSTSNLHLDTSATKNVVLINGVKQGNYISLLQYFSYVKFTITIYFSSFVHK